MRKITSDEGKRQTLSRMFHRYHYESDVYPSLSRIPLHVRMKLDLTGIKISLKLWLHFSIQERTVLCHLPVETEEEKRVFSAYVDFLSRRYSGESVATTVALSSSLWDTSNQVPAAVLDRSAGSTRAISVKGGRAGNRTSVMLFTRRRFRRVIPNSFLTCLKNYVN